MFELTSKMNVTSLNLHSIRDVTKRLIDVITAAIPDKTTVL